MTKPKRIIIKLGTSTLTRGSGELSIQHLLELVRVLAGLHAEGYEVILVSSGAIAVGRSLMGYPSVPKHLPAKQMLASVGQSRLMELYSQLFGFYDIKAGQVLLTREDLSARRRYLNARNTLEAMIQYRIIPIINENDTVSTEEIRLGDNDNLSALVANLTEADLLIMLTDQKGLFHSDPRQNPSAEIISEINEEVIPAWVWQAAGGSVSGLGTGGMSTKVLAAELARRSGSEVVIANGNDPQVIWQILQGEKIGTRFSAINTKLESRKRYLLAESRNGQGSLKIDDGAVEALQKGGSLLPVGIIEIHGDFQRGDVTSIQDQTGKDIGYGMVNYNANDVRQIVGVQSQEIENVLGYTYGMEVIHHNNLLLTRINGGAEV